jgi:hypothetical protein
MAQYRLTFFQDVPSVTALVIEADSPEHAAQRAREILNGDGEELNESTDNEIAWDCAGPLRVGYVEDLNCGMTPQIWHVDELNPALDAR